MDRIHLAQDVNHWQAVVNIVLNLLSSIESRKFLD
jgi:hypothetical protein